MKVALINASPKLKNSTSGILLEYLRDYLVIHGVDIQEEKAHSIATVGEVSVLLKDVDSAVFALPLYVDGVPSHLLSILSELEKQGNMNKVNVYAIVNCGFYEGIQAEHALKIIENWCKKSNNNWCGGLGIGGGGALAMMPVVEGGKGPRGAIDNEISKLAERIIDKENTENQYPTVKFPRALYKLAAQIGWRRSIKANGGTIKDLGRQIEL